MYRPRIVDYMDKSSLEGRILSHAFILAPEYVNHSY